MLDTRFLASPRVSGALLVASFLMFLLALILMVASGAMPAFSKLLGGSVAAITPYAEIFRWVYRVYAIGWVLELLGFVALTVLLVRTRDDLLPILALSGMVLAVFMGLLEATFHLGLTPWAAAEATRTGVVPPAYVTLKHWVGTLQDTYMVLGFLSLAAYGWALLQSDLLPSWVGIATVAWGLGWLAVLAGTGWEIPAVLFLFPPVIGGAVLTLT